MSALRLVALATTLVILSLPVATADPPGVIINPGCDQIQELSENGIPIPFDPSSQPPCGPPPAGGGKRR